MKILILREPQTTRGTYPEGLSGGSCYLTDMLLHGLRNKFGNDIVEYERAWWMYYEDFGPGKRDPKLYGHQSFSIYRSIGSDKDVDRTDIETKIRNQYYDFIVFGYTHYGLRPGSWELVTNHYPKNKIAYIDGGDLWSDLKPNLIDKCIYFKRELYESTPGLHPISFAIPREKIGTVYREKSEFIAPMDPRNPSSYIYKEERPYYEQYANSLFGITMKKNGWDCLRHYEIMANNCIPLFLDINQCPENIMKTLPKEQLKEALSLVNHNGVEWFKEGTGFDKWFNLNDQIQDHFRKYCTTDALAMQFIDTMNSYN